MNLILDANILVKLVLHEEDSKIAREAVTNASKKGMAVYTVDVALAEALNVLWKHVNTVKDLKIEEAMPVVEDLARVYDRLNIVKAREIVAPATQIALSQNITVYDALYFAAAQQLNGTLYTADLKLCNAAKRYVNVRLLKAETTSDA